MIATHDIKHDPSGAVLTVKYRASVRDQYSYDRKSFLKRENAEAYLRKLQKDVLVKQLCNYVGQCEIIIKHSKYSSPKYLAIRECLHVKKYCLQIGVTRVQVARFVLMNNKHLKKILPHAKNEGRNTAEGNLNDVLSQARAIVNRARMRVSN